MTAATLYETDADFRALIQCWIDNRRCPLPMADYLRERDLEGQAEAAEWAFWEEKPDDSKGYLRPRIAWFRPHIAWWCAETDTYRPENGIPVVLSKCTDGCDKAENEVGAMLWLLDRWAEVKASGVELPKVEAGVVTN